MTRALDHYERFPALIDLFRDWPYSEARAAAIRALQLRAGHRIRQHRLDASRIELHRINLAQDRDAMRDVISPASDPPSLLITLALSCFASFDEVFGDIYDALPAGTRIALMELHLERRSLVGRVINWVGAADCTRRTWEPLERRLVDYHRVDFPLRFSKLFVASGRKGGQP